MWWFAKRPETPGSQRTGRSRLWFLWHLKGFRQLRTMLFPDHLWHDCFYNGPSHSCCKRQLDLMSCPLCINLPCQNEVFPAFPVEHECCLGQFSAPPRCLNILSVLGLLQLAHCLQTTTLQLWISNFSKTYTQANRNKYSFLGWFLPYCEIVNKWNKPLCWQFWSFSKKTQMAGKGKCTPTHLHY